MKLKGLMILCMSALLIALISGCGASKGYVDQRVAEARAESQAEVDALKKKAALNTDDIKKLQKLSSDLDKKTEIALNQAEGFETYQIIWEGVVNFEFDSYEMTQISKENIEDLGKKMIDNPRSLLELVGHTDQSGPAKYNIELGMMRAESIKQYVFDNFGIALYRMFTASQGEARPIALPDAKDAYSKNRRVVLKLWGDL